MAPCLLAGKVSWPTYFRHTANHHFTLLRPELRGRPRLPVQCTRGGESGGQPRSQPCSSLPTLGHRQGSRCGGWGEDDPPPPLLDVRPQLTTEPFNLYVQVGTNASTITDYAKENLAVGTFALTADEVSALELLQL